MAGFRRSILALAVLALAAGLASAQIGVGPGQMTCGTNVVAVPLIRAEGYTEQTADIILTCTGGATPALGSQIPTVDISVTLNTSVTSRLLPVAAAPDILISEALLMIDEPGSGITSVVPGFGPEAPQRLCGVAGTFFGAQAGGPTTGCSEFATNLNGVTVATDTSQGVGLVTTAVPGANVFQGIVNSDGLHPNTVTFFGVPVLPPVVTGIPRVFRITNIRANATALSRTVPAAVTASIVVSNPSALPILNSVLTVAFVQSGLSALVSVAPNLSQCQSAANVSVSTLTFSSGFSTAFKTRVLAQSDILYAGQGLTAVSAPGNQNIPGMPYSSESNFVLPINSTQTAGLADFGTRLKAAFNNVPAGVRLFVSVANVTSNLTPVTPPAIPGGSAGNRTSQPYAQLVPGETSADGNAGVGGFFPAAPANGFGLNTAEVLVVNGSATAVWEVVNTNPAFLGTLNFAVYATFTSNVPQNSPPPGVATVNLSFAPPPPALGSIPLSIPRFIADPNPASSLFNITACAPLLAVAKTHTGTFTQGQNGAAYSVTVSNATGASLTSGTVTVTETVPTGMTLVSMSGTGWTCPVGSACTRSDVLAPGASYPAIAVTVNIGAGASSPQVNSVTVSGGGSAPATITDSTIVNAPPQLSIAETHTGNFIQGQTNTTYTVTVSNPAGAGPAGGTVTVTETAPAGLTLVSMSGTGWACGGATCTRSDTLAGGASYPAITVTVNVSSAAPSSVTNQVTVSGGGSAAASANDVTFVGPPVYLISTLAGNVQAPTALPGTQAGIGRPRGVAADATGNIYIASGRNVVFKLDTNGTLTRVAGTSQAGFSGDNGPALSAQLNQPAGMAVDSAGNLYVADSGNSRIRKVAPDGTIVTVAGNGVAGFSGDDSPATSAQLRFPTDVAADASGNLYIADASNNRVRKVAADGTITTIAGTATAGNSGDNGPATRAQLNFPRGVAVDSSGNIYIADSSNYRIRKIAAGTITTFAGSVAGFSGDTGPAVDASLNFPVGVAADALGNLYIADQSNSRIRKVNGGIITTIAGTGALGYGGDGGPATSATLDVPDGVAVDASGNLYIADDANLRVRKVSVSGIIGTVAGGATGDGNPAPFGTFNIPSAIAVDAGGNRYIADSYNHRIRKIAPGGTVSTVAGTGVSGSLGDGGPAASARLNFPSGVTVDTSGNLYIGDTMNFCVRKVDTSGIITTVAGNGFPSFSGDGGPATSAGIQPPAGLALDLSGNLYIATYGDSRVRKVATNGIITTVAGNGIAAFSGDGGPATSASLSSPWGLATDPAGNLYVADGNNSRVRKLATNGTITTVAGNGIAAFSGDGGLATNASLSQVFGIAVDSSGNLYIADTGASRIRMVNSAGIITTIAGVAGNSGYWGDGGPASTALLSGPEGVAVDSNGDVYLADNGNDAIRLLTLFGVRPVLIVSSTHAGNFTTGQPGEYTVTVSNAFFAGASSGPVTVTEVAFNTVLSSMSGTGWTCGGNTCTRSDALVGGASYSPITVTVNVPAAAPAQITNQVTVSGGGGAMTGASDLTLVSLSPPSLLITKTHTGNLTQGQNGAAYSVTVSNATGSRLTSGTVTVTETVPPGMTLVSMAGTGWTCASNSCTRSDALAGGAIYPAITATVNVAGNAGSPQVNQVSVAGGGSAGANASDSTTINVGIAGDFNGDGHEDVIWQDPVTGLAQIWLLGSGQGTGLLKAVNLTAGNTWRVVGVGDFNQDGHPDVVWQDPVSGAAQVWFLGGPLGNVLTGAATLSNGNTWRIVSVADFNGDGRPDVIWQDPVTGLAQIWFLGGAQGVTVNGAVNLTKGNTWRIVGTGDFNHDGHPDVVWQDPVTGTVQVWYLNGPQGNVVFAAVNLTGSNPWRIASVGDYNGDGNPDVVWQDPVSGTSQAWFLGGPLGTTLIGSSALSVANSWRIVGPR